MPLLIIFAHCFTMLIEICWIVFLDWFPINESIFHPILSSYLFIFPVKLFKIFIFKYFSMFTLISSFSFSSSSGLTNGKCLQSLRESSIEQHPCRTQRKDLYETWSALRLDKWTRYPINKKLYYSLQKITIKINQTFKMALMPI